VTRVAQKVPLAMNFDIRAVSTNAAVHSVINVYKCRIRVRSAREMSDYSPFPTNSIQHYNTALTKLQVSLKQMDGMSTMVIKESAVDPTKSSLETERGKELLAAYRVKMDVPGAGQLGTSHGKMFNATLVQSPPVTCSSFPAAAAFNPIGIKKHTMALSDMKKFRKGDSCDDSCDDNCDFEDMTRVDLELSYITREKEK